MYDILRKLLSMAFHYLQRKPEKLKLAKIHEYIIYFVTYVRFFSKNAGWILSIMDLIKSFQLSHDQPIAIFGTKILLIIVKWERHCHKNEKVFS